MRICCSAAIAIALTLAEAPLVSAADGGGKVTGTVVLPKPEERPAPPVRNRGFFERMPNPVRPPQTLDPLPEMVVVLEGGPIDPDDAEAPRRAAKYILVGQSFEVPILPVVAGSKIELVNKSKRSPRLHCPAAPNLLDGEPVSPNGERELREPISGPFELVEIRDKDAVHVRGAILPVPHSYFSRVDGSGSFEIEGVPAGTWKVKVWYRDGWLSLPGESTVEVRAGRPSSVKVEVPAALDGSPGGEE